MGSILGNTATGASTGASFGPVGAAVGGLIGLGTGIVDTIKGNRKLKAAQSFWENNKNQIPEAAKSALGVAERQATLGMPGEDIARSRLAEATATGIGAAQNAGSSLSDVLGQLALLSQGQQRGEQNIALESARRYDANQSLLQQELGRMGQLEQQQWEYNSLMPYQQMLGQAEAYSNRGRQGISSGIGAIGQAAGLYTQMQGAQNGINDLYSNLGLTFGAANPQNTMSPMIPIQPNFQQNLNTNQLMPM